MSIRKRIFGTYLVLIFIIIAYIGISGVASLLREEVEADRASILELRNSWDATRALLNDMVINWDNGALYAEFKWTRFRFDKQLGAIRGTVSVRWYYPGEVKHLLDALDHVWSMADEHLNRVDAAVEHPDFLLVSKLVRGRPGAAATQPPVERSLGTERS